MLIDAYSRSSLSRALTRVALAPRSLSLVLLRLLSNFTSAPHSQVHRLSSNNMAHALPFSVSALLGHSPGKPVENDDRSEDRATPDDTSPPPPLSSLEAATEALAFSQWRDFVTRLYRQLDYQLVMEQVLRTAQEQQQQQRLRASSLDINTDDQIPIIYSRNSSSQYSSGKSGKYVVCVAVSCSRLVVASISRRAIELRSLALCLIKRAFSGVN